MVTNTVEPTVELLGKGTGTSHEWGRRGDGELQQSRSGWSYRAQGRAAEGISSPLFGVGARLVFKVVSGDPSPSS